MRNAAVLTAAVLTTLALAPDASGQSSPPRSSRPRSECFDARFVSSFSAPNDQTVYIKVGTRDVYRLSLFSPCLNVDWTQAIGLKSIAGSDWICRGVEAELIVPNRQLGRQRCLVSDIHKLTPEELAALPRRDRP